MASFGGAGPRSDQKHHAEEQHAEGVERRRDPLEHPQRHVENDPRPDDAKTEPEELVVPSPGGPSRDVCLTRRVQGREPKEDQPERHRDQLPVYARRSHGPGASAESAGVWIAAESGSSSSGWGVLSPGLTDSSLSFSTFTGPVASGPRM